MFVDVVVMAMTAEMIANGIHCDHVVHDGQSDEEKGGDLHDRNGLIQISCIWKMLGVCGWVDCGNNTNDPTAPFTRERDREKGCVLTRLLQRCRPKIQNRAQRSKKHVNRKET